MFFTGVDFLLVSLFRRVKWDFGSTWPGSFSLDWIWRIHLPGCSPKNHYNVFVFFTSSLLLIFFYPFFLPSSLYIYLCRHIRKRMKVLKSKDLGLRVSLPCTLCAGTQALPALCHNFPPSQRGNLMHITKFWRCESAVFPPQTSLRLSDITLLSS